MASWLRVWLEIVMWDLLREGIKLKLFLGKCILDIGTWTECIPLSFPKAWIFSVFILILFFLRRMFTFHLMCWIRGNCRNSNLLLYLSSWVTKITHSCGILSSNLEDKKHPTGGQKAYGLIPALTLTINCMALGKFLTTPGLNFFRYKVAKCVGVAVLMSWYNACSSAL